MTSPLGRALLPLASGVLLAAATPPALSPLLPFIALVPLAVFVAALPADAGGSVAAASGGFAAGLIQHGWGLRWLPGTLGAVAGRAVGVAGSAAVVLVLAGLTGAAAVLLHRLVAREAGLPFGAPRRGWPARTVGRTTVSIAAALPVVWTALEWALAHLPLGLAFPWAPLGLGLARWPETLGIAELVGVRGATLWLAAVNGLLARGVLGARAARTRTAAPAALAALGLALLPVAWGRWRAAAVDAPVVGRAAAFSLALPARAAPLERAERALRETEELLARLRPATLDLVVLPEMALPLDPGSAAAAPFVARLRERSAALGAPLLVGALGVEGGREYNSAVLVGGDASAPAFRADKRHLVPGVERASAVHAAWLAPRDAGYAAGRGPLVARLGRLRAGALVCYDVAFAEDARSLVQDGARTLAALTSDAWFGEGGARGAGVAQQLAHLALRAIETRTSAVRASAGGPAVIVGPSGRAEPEATGFRASGAGADSAAAVVEGPVRSSTRPTLFVRTGDLAGPASAAALAALLFLE